MKSAIEAQHCRYTEQKISIRAVKKRLTSFFTLWDWGFSKHQCSMLLVLILWSVASDRRFASHWLLFMFFVCLECNVFLLLNSSNEHFWCNKYFRFPISHLCNHEILMNITITVFSFHKIILCIHHTMKQKHIATNFWEYSFFSHIDTQTRKKQSIRQSRFICSFSSSQL